MVRQVRGLGTLTPEDIRWIPATTQGRVEKIVLRPGTSVKAGDVILELTNPQLEHQSAVEQRPAADARDGGAGRGRFQQGEDAGADERGARVRSARLRARAE